MYNLVAQISYHQTDLLDMTDHFYSRVKISDQYYKMDGKSSTTKKTFANPENVILAPERALTVVIWAYGGYLYL